MIRFLQSKGATQKGLLWAFILFVCVSMVAFLGNYFISDANAVGADGVFATVGHQTIRTGEVRDEAQRSARQLTRGQPVPESFLSYFNQRAAANLIVGAALLEEASRLHITVSDAELSEELRKSPALGPYLFPEGKFVGREAYRNFVYGNYQMEVPVFEAQVKKSLLINKLRLLVEGGITVSPEDIQSAYEQQNVKVRFDYAVLSTADLAKSIKATDSELKAYFEQNRSKYENSIPARRKVAYVVLDPGKQAVQLTDQDFQLAYEARKKEFEAPEEVDVRHILVKTREQALDIKKQLEAGARFEDLAKKYSEDPGSKDNGGLYANTPRKRMVPAFDDAAFSLPVGKISDPVQTSFGYHILRVDAHRPARVKPLEEVRSQLESSLRAEKATRMADALADRIIAEARTVGLEKAAAQHAQKVVTSDYFAITASLPGIGAAPQFMQQVFGLEPRAVEKLAIPTGVALVEVLDVKPAATPSFAEVRSQVETEFKTDRAAQMLAQKTGELADRAHALNNLRQAARESGATVRTSDWVTPSSTVQDLGSMSGPGAVAFTLQPRQISNAISTGGNTGVVLALLERKEPGPEEFARQREAIRERLLQQKRDEYFNLFANQLRERYQKEGKISINPKEEALLFKRNGPPQS
jgi:peptidyl-prolyl cis-trans isomerase D